MRACWRRLPRQCVAARVSDDPYVYPGTDVLRNARGIRDGAELERIEASLTYLRSLQRNIDASVAAMHGDERPLRELLAEITTPLA